MKKKFLSIICLIAIFGWGLLAAENKNSKKIIHTAPTAPPEIQKSFDERQFKTHMVKHYNEGCPTNSECSAEMGSLFKRWTQSLENFSTEKEGWRLLEKFRKSNGVPFEVWTTSKATAKEKVIFWDSPCESHNKEKEENFGIGIVMVKHLDELKKLEQEGKVHLRFLKLFQSEKEPIIDFKTLRGETPLYIDGKKLIYQKLEDGYSYGVSVKPTGELNVVSTQTPPEFPRSMDCPKNLVESFDKKDKLMMPKNLYAGVYCQRTWNISRKKFDILMVGWSCN